MKVAIFGAGGPVGAMAARALKDHYTLRLTDLRPLVEIVAEGKPQSAGAPLPELLPPPHETRQVDVTDYEQVLETSRGTDALVNCTVVRPHLAAAFAVNMIGAYNIARAAAELGIRRIIQTAPQLVILGHAADYLADFDVPDDAPPRPGGELYSLSKFLGGEILRVFAERHALEVIEFAYCGFRTAAVREDERGRGLFHFMTAWEDTGTPFLHALRAPSEALEQPYERFHITSRLPQGKWGGSGKAQRVLGWAPQHAFRAVYVRAACRADESAVSLTG